MNIVEPDGRLLSELADDFATNVTEWGGGAHQVSVALASSDPIITFGEHEVPATETGLAALATFFNVPAKFLLRIEPDEQDFVLNHRIDRSEERDLTINYREGGVLDVLKAGQRKIPAEAIVETAMKVLPGESLVVEAWSDPDDLRIDIVVPDGFDRGIGGDARVGDLTKGGLRFGQNRKQNLAPWVQTFLYRLACTNGMEVPNLGLKVDARGESVEEVLAVMEAKAQLAFAAVEAEIESFYSLRNEPVGDDRTGVLRRVAQDAGLPDRTVGQLEDFLPEIIEDGAEASMFDLVNTITNLANHESLMNRRGPRRQLQQAGGGVIGVHTERCNLCHQRL